MSMPSSSEEVATIARRRPSFNASSTSVRCSRASEPWCARTRSSSASSFRRAARRSAIRRALTNTIVDRCARISSSSFGWIAGQIDAADGERPSVDGPRTSGMGPGRSTTLPSSAMSSTGTMTSISIGLRWPASTIVTGRGPSVVCPPRNRAISSSGRCVADRPMRCGGVSVSCSSRSSESARCAPRFVAAIAWISSMITQRTLRSVSRACDVSIRYRDSGVVIEDVGRPLEHLATLVGRRVAGTDAHGWLVRERDAGAVGGVLDAGERRTEVLLDVDGQRPER